MKIFISVIFFQTSLLWAGDIHEILKKDFVQENDQLRPIPPSKKWNQIAGLFSSGQHYSLNEFDQDGKLPLQIILEGNSFASSLSGSDNMRTSEMKQLFSNMVKSGADVNKKYPNGDTLLHKVASREIQVRDDERRGEWGPPVRLRVDRILKSLMEHGPNINAVNASGQTPLHALLSSGKATLEEAMFLITNGADLNAKDHSGRTPMDMLTEEGMESVPSSSDEMEFMSLFIQREMAQQGLQWPNICENVAREEDQLICENANSDQGEIQCEGESYLKKQQSPLWKFLNFFGGNE